MNKFFNTLLLCLIFLSVNAFTQHAPVSVSSSVDKTRIKIGDVVTYTVSISYDKDIKIKPPGSGENLGAFEIRSYKIYDPKKQGKRIRLDAEYKISTFTTGDYFIPPLTIYYKTEGDSVYKSISTEKIKIVVESMNPSEQGDIRDIKLPVEIPATLWEKIRIFVFVFAALILGALIYLYFRLKKEGRSLIPEKKEPPRPPHEIALEMLDQLKEKDLVSQGKIKEFHIEVSDIIRRYIEGRYFIPAPEMTTSELLASIKSEQIEPEQMELLSRFLFQCDMVKFAKFIPNPAESSEMLQLAYRFVNETKIIIVTQEHDKSETSEEESETVEEQLKEEQI